MRRGERPPAGRGPACEWDTLIADARGRRDVSCARSYEAWKAERRGARVLAGTAPVQDATGPEARSDVLLRAAAPAPALAPRARPRWR